MKKLLTVSIPLAIAILVTYFLPYGTWASIGDLPAHPLIVHGVVVLFPLLGLVVIFALFKKNVFKRIHIPLIASAGFVTIGVLAAKSSGDSLSAAVGLPKTHAEWGNNLVPLAMAFFAALVLFSVFSFYKKISVLSKTLKGLLVVISVASIGMTYVVGHTGAESVWKAKYSAALNSEKVDLEPITLDEVKQHNKISDCWTVVDGYVYDVTTFAYRHPAGPPGIKEMCGKDATEDFQGEHQGQGEPEKWLETLKIGKLSK